MSVPDIDDVTFNVHFIALFSAKQNAIPVLMLHGWPGKQTQHDLEFRSKNQALTCLGNVMEFFPILNILQQKYTPDTLPYHIIVPSLPGYAFSSPPPLFKDFQIQDVARVMNTFMTQLGFGEGYVVQGGDIGSKVARVIAAEYDACKGVRRNTAKLQYH